MVTIQKLSTQPKAVIGGRYGRLTVIDHAEPYKGKYRQWLVRCACGAEKVVMDQSLRSGATSSCGCLALEMLTDSAIHGHAAGRKQTKEYMAWRDMMQRCYNPKNPSYHNYGGRGITVCEAWHAFTGFLADMGLAPEGLTLDRVNESRNYEKLNCAWADWLDQGCHKRTNRRLTFKGRTLSVADWARRLGIKPETIHSRLRRGLPISQTLSRERLPYIRKAHKQKEKQ